VDFTAKIPGRNTRYGIPHPFAHSAIHDTI